jgi:hypothetical protein
MTSFPLEMLTALIMANTLREELELGDITIPAVRE